MTAFVFSFIKVFSSTFLAFSYFCGLSIPPTYFPHPFGVGRIAPNRIFSLNMVFLNWIDFDNNPIVWWVLGHIFLLILSIWLIRARRPISDWIFWTSIVFISAFMRLPIFLYNLPLNPDESQMLAQGLTLTFDPLLYRSVDPTTIGPINNYLLALLGFLGFKLDFQLAHVLSWLLLFPTLFYGYKTLLILQNRLIAQLALLPTLAFISFIQEPNYIHYYSESIAIILLSLNVYLIARWSQRKNIFSLELVVFGIATALVILCKIQALPLAFVLGTWSLVQLLMFQKSQFFLKGIVLVFTISSIWGGWIVYLWQNGVLEDFFFYYIKANAQLKMHFSDASSRSYFYLLVRFPLIFLKLGEGIKYLFLPFGVLSVPFLLKNKRKTAFLKAIQMQSYFWAMLLSYLLMVIATLIRTGSFYPHHFTYFMLPFYLFTGLFLSQLNVSWRWVILSTQLVFLAIFIKRLITYSSINLYATTISKQEAISDVSRSILKYAQPGEYLVVWGWDCSYYVETQMPQGVNENHSVRSAMKHPLQMAYYERYLRDIKRTKPVVFVDAMTEKTLWMYDPEKYGHQNYPALAAYISQNYELKEVIEGIKIYARK